MFQFSVCSFAKEKELWERPMSSSGRILTDNDDNSGIHILIIFRVLNFSGNTVFPEKVRPLFSSIQKCDTDSE